MKPNHNSGFLVTKYSHLKSFRHRLLKGFEGVQKPVIIEIKVVFYMSYNPSPKKVSSKGLSVLPAVGETALDQPCYQVSTLNYTSPPALIAKHLFHTCSQVVPYEHGRDSSGGGVKVLPRRQMYPVSAIEQAATECSRSYHQVPCIDAKQGESEDGLAEVEKPIEEDQFQIDSRHSLHAQRPDAEGGADKHGHREEEQEEIVLSWLQVRVGLDRLFTWRHLIPLQQPRAVGASGGVAPVATSWAAILPHTSISKVLNLNWGLLLFTAPLLIAKQCFPLTSWGGWSAACRSRTCVPLG